MKMSTPLPIAADHPAYAGHFPNFPVFPGAALLDRALVSIQLARGINLTEWQITGAKFIDMVRPGDDPTIEHEAASPVLIRFTIRVAERAVVTGTLAKPSARAVP